MRLELGYNNDLDREGKFEQLRIQMERHAARYDAVETEEPEDEYDLLVRTPSFEFSLTPREATLKTREVAVRPGATATERDRDICTEIQNVYDDLFSIDDLLDEDTRWHR